MPATVSEHFRTLSSGNTQCPNPSYEEITDPGTIAQVLQYLSYLPADRPCITFYNQLGLHTEAEFEGIQLSKGDVRLMYSYQGHGATCSVDHIRKLKLVQA